MNYFFFSMRAWLVVWRGYDWVLMSAAVVLMMVGMAAIYSVDLSRGSSLDYFPTQVVASLLGLAVLLSAAHIHVTVYQWTAKSIYLVAFLLLFTVLLFGQTIRGTTGWFRFGGLSFQPAEFAKVALVLFLGYMMSRQGRRFDRWQFVVASGVMTALFMGLILLQPDLGSALVLGALWLGLLVLIGTRPRYLAAILGGGLMVVVVSWFFLFAPYQKDRVLVFLDPQRDALGAGYNVAQSIIAIGAGQWMGRGLGFGSQSQLHFLPEAQTDFIFSVIAEELGFVGVMLVLLLYGVVLTRLIVIARHCPDDFSTYTVLGIALVFFIHIIFNIGAATGLLPVTGLTLPFVSYGGSSLIMNCLLVGIAESIARSRSTFPSAPLA